jgi:L-ornithine Nalpha-acyltransferase
MAARRVRLSIRLRNAGRRWGFSRDHMIVPRRPRFGTRPKQNGASTATPQEASAAARPKHVWPVIAASGSLEARIAQTAHEIEAAQRLRYRVFYEEMSAIPTPEMRAASRDFDKYDSFCDHILVIDREARDENGEPPVVGTYRLLRGEVAAAHGGYYTSSEYDLTAMLMANPPGTRFLELGRSCVLKAYRSRAVTMQLLWKGVLAYVARYSIDVMFGCGSLPGTDPEKLALSLSYLHHFHRAPERVCVRARPELYVSMNRMAKEDIDPKEAMRALPPLIKGYIRSGTFIGDGAVVDKQFGTTDVLIYLPMSQLDPRLLKKHGSKRPN